ncbi:adenylate cyclase [Leptolyngbya valderiana BDU 20041]|nr:adenylate cyclase [Leptolyngbya valderiana BDU 20041]
MGVEIERKFLLADSSWKRGARGLALRQAYLSTDPDRTVRVRVAEVEPGEHRGWLTIKGRSNGPVRAEYEYPIPADEAGEMIDILCVKPAIEKIRYRVDHQGDGWEIDEFSGANAGLVLAEIELESVEQRFATPPWLGREVTDDPRYTNAQLSCHPFTDWAR